MSTTHFAKNELNVFLFLTFGLSSVFYALIIQAGSLEANGGWYVFLLMWCPGLAALITRWLHHRNFRGLGWGWGKSRYQLWAYLLPLLYGGVVYLLIWLSGLGAFDAPMLDNLRRAYGDDTPGWLAVLLFVGLGTGLSFISAIGEEIGWRGFLVPALYDRFRFGQTALISGVIWTLWHAPLILFSDYHNTAPAGYALFCFAVLAIGISYVFAWLRLKSGSLWTAALLHASHNLYIQGFFDRVTGNTGTTAYWSGEFGAGLAIAAVLLAIFFYSRRHQLYRDPDAVAAD